MDNNENVSHRQSAFIGQVNNVLCYFNILNSHTKYRLFRSYCTSFCGGELWCLSDDEVQGACALRGGKVFAKCGNCPAERTAISCLYCAGVFPYLTNYSHAHLDLYTDIFPVIQIF